MAETTPPPGPPVRPQVVHVITGLNNGGAEGTLFRLCTHPDSPASVIVSLTGDGLHGPRLRALGFEVIALGMPRGRVTLAGVIRLWCVFRRVRPEVVQTWMYHADLLGGVIARLCGIRRVVWGIRSTRFASRGSAWRVAQICARLSRMIPQAIICCADTAAAEHARMGYTADRMTVIANGFDTQLLSPNPDLRRQMRSRLALSPDNPVIGFVARFDPQKDHKTLFAALAALQAQGSCPTCLLIGPDMVEGNSALADLIDAAGVRAHLRLLGPQSDIRAVMNALDLHVMSSQSEGFPNVLAEAMACGCPCVSTDVGAAAQIIGDTGWIVPAKDPAALAKALATALATIHGPDWTARKEAARARVVQSYSLKTMVSAFRKVWGC